jgi:hypothetical protein
MKTILFFVCLFVSGTFVYGQKLPNNPNTTDKNGLRQGKWTITYE